MTPAESVPPSGIPAHDTSNVPSGRRLIYSHYPSLGAVDLFTMRLDGTHRRHVTRTPGVIELAARWQPRN